MEFREYEKVRKTLVAVRMLGNIDPEEVAPITALQWAADENHSITLQLYVLQRLFRKELDAEAAQCEIKNKEVAQWLDMI